MPFQHYPQRDAMDCGPTCLRMVARHYGRLYALPLLREWCYIDREGVSLSGISEAAERVGLRTLAVRVDYDKLHEDAPLPCIAHWNQNHFVVVYKATRRHVWVADPAAGKFKLTRAEFEKSWSVGADIVIDAAADAAPFTARKGGILLLLEPTPDFYKDSDDDSSASPTEQSGAFLWQYLRPHTRLIAQLAVGLLVGSGLQLLFPISRKRW